MSNMKGTSAEIQKVSEKYFELNMFPDGMVQGLFCARMRLAEKIIQQVEREGENGNCPVCLHKEGHADDCELDQFLEPLREQGEIRQDV